MAGWPHWAAPIVRAILGNEAGPISATNPLPVTQAGGGVAQTVDQGAAGVAPWKVDDDATQVLLGGGLPSALSSDRLKGESVGNVAAGAADSGNPIKTGGKYNAAAPTLADGNRGDTQLDVNANLKVTLATLLAGEYLTENALAVLEQCVSSANFGPSQYTYWAGAITKANIKNAPGNVYGVIVTNANAAARYLQLHNKATAPAAAEVPLASYLIPGGTAANPGVVLLDRNYFSALRFGTGLGWAVSTTQATFTDAATASEHSLEVLYK